MVVALHGGGYTSAYFDVPGHSLLSLAASLGIRVVALDRPGYGASEATGPGDHSHAANAAILEAAISDLLARREQSAAVLVGHSIGGAIAARIAANRPSWLRGLAVSGVGLANAAGDRAAWQALPDVPFVEVPTSFKDTKMFGRPGTYSSDAPAASHVADAPTPRAELIEIVTGWPEHVREVLAAIVVPVHYRQGADDALWQVDAAQVAAFADGCSAAPWVDAATIDDAGHCIDFHQTGASFQREQLAFALKCSASAPEER